MLKDKVLVTFLLLIVFLASGPYLGLENVASNSFKPSNLADDYDFAREVETLAQAVETPISTPTPRPQVAIAFAEKKQIIPTANPVTITPTPQIVETKKIVSNLPNVDSLLMSTIDTVANEYGVSADMMKKIAECESGFRADAVNGPYLGMYQFHESTWKSNRVAMGLDSDPSLRANPEEAIKTAAFKMARDGYGAWPVCSKV